MNSIQKIRSQKERSYIVISSIQQYSKQYIAQNFSVKYVDKGLEQYKINGQAHDLPEQNMLVVNPGQEIEIEVDTIENVNGKCFFFDPLLISQILYAKHNSTKGNLEPIEVDYFNDVFRNIPINIYGTGFETLLKKTNLETLKNEEQVLDFLISLAEQLVVNQNDMELNLSRLESDKKATRLELYQRIQKGRQYIHDNFNQKISLSKMAKAAGLSEYYFHRNYRNYFQLTPHQYLSKIRIEKANAMYMEGKYALSEIAFLCGFSDSKYLKKVLRKKLSDC